MVSAVQLVAPPRIDTVSPDQSDHDASGNLISPFYGYLPTQNVCFIFVSLFGISLGKSLCPAPIGVWHQPSYSPQRHTGRQVPCLVALSYGGPCSDGRDSGLVWTAVVILCAVEPDSICYPVRCPRSSFSSLPSQSLLE